MQPLRNIRPLLFCLVVLGIVSTLNLFRYKFDFTQTACTQELGISIEPQTITLRSQEAVTPKVELLSCGGTQRLRDRYSWTSVNPAVATVDSKTGMVTGLSVGGTSIQVKSKTYGMSGAIPVEVVDSTKMNL